ncbi:hypothetical protein LLW09_07435 [Pseudomonas paracarnis]|uniref:Uncharacterized protein n=1 Tax=Pseudomonas paracarnis TaxID=2750625 RepID=A0ABU6BRF0_9PSED|nr:hypothetical protein [Pseudomonas paracarnis]MEB3782386.1 hypothetical protein [Pseudomonas paracarnis]
MRLSLGFADGVVSTLRTIVAGFVTFFLLFFFMYGYSKFGPSVIYDHKFLIMNAPLVMGACFLYFGKYLGKMEGEV